MLQPVLVENRPLKLYKEAKEKLGINGKPVILGPITLLALSKGCGEQKRNELLKALVPLYIEVLQQLAEAGADWIQIDEPILVKPKLMMNDYINSMKYIQHLIKKFQM